jgi:4-diphosphocytidyl-2-C-methyl-D-erythritol kinase
MVIFPNCKINLGLHIIRKRTDGFHNLETVFYPLQLKDALEIIRADQTIGSIPEISFTASGLPIEGESSNNLCIKAYHLLKKDFPGLLKFKMHLHKVIPMGAGLGGGSADGAFALQLFNQLGNLGLSQEQLLDYALQLGSDCPFFINNKPCFATSRGEQMKELDLNLSGYRFVIVNPGIHISTAWAFAHIHPATPERQLTDIVTLPVTEWKNLLSNDFEAPVLQAYPELQQIKDQFYQTGALYASMSGSGSTFYGIYEKSANPHLTFPPDYLQIHL